MKRFFIVLLALSMFISCFQGLVVFSESMSVIRDEVDSEIYTESKIKNPEFKNDRYYRLYNDNGQVFSFVEDNGLGKFVFETPEKGNKRQEWQIIKDPKSISKYRIISKYSGEALAISENPFELSVKPVDLNDLQQEWSLSASKGMFNIKVNNIGKLTYSGQRVRAALPSNTAKQFEIREIQDTPWHLDWSDDFNGNLDESKWNKADGHLQGDESPVMNVGDDDHVYTEDGDLVLVTDIGDYGGYEMKGGLVDTAGKYAFSYGRLEMRAKLPKGEGTFPALWLLGNENMWPGNGEIDIMEIDNDGADNKDAYLYGTLHWADSKSNHISEGSHFFNKDFVALGDDYHTYALEWEYDQIRLFFDDMLYMTLNIDDSAKKFSFGDEPHFIILDNWIECHQAGRLIEDINYEQKYVYKIDYIKTYKRENTANYEVLDQTSSNTTVTSTAADVVGREHDWDEEMPIAVSPDGKELAVAEGVYFLNIIDAETMLQKRMIQLEPMFCLSAISYSPDGTKLAVANCFGSVYVFDTSDYSKEPLVINAGTTCIEQIIFSNDSSSLIISGMPGRSTHQGGKNVIDGSVTPDESMRVYSVVDGSILFEKVLGEESRGIAISDDGKYVAFALFNGSCIVFDTTNYEVVSNMDTLDNVQLRGIDISSDNSKLAVASESGEIYLFDIITGELIRKFNTIKKTSITQTCFSPDNSKLLVNSSDNCARIYNVETGSLYAVLGGFNGKITKVSYSPNGEFVAIGSIDGRIKLFDKTGEYLYTLVTSLTEYNGLVYDLSFSNDNKYVYATTYTCPKFIHKWRTDGVSENPSALYDVDFTYFVDGDNAVITGYRGNDRNIIIPDVIDGHIVTEIGAFAFNYFGNYWRNISITLPETIKAIGFCAFKDCWSLKEINLPMGLERIESYAFAGCKQLTRISIPDSVVYLGKEIFRQCHGLEVVTLGGGVKKIESGLFGNSRGIEKVIIRDGVEELESGVFTTSLIQKVYLPDSINSIKKDSFEGSGIIYGSDESYAELYCETDNRYSFMITPSRIGDVDADFEVTINDALMALRTSLKIISCSTEMIHFGDINNDEMITITDVMMILRISVLN